MSVICPNCGSEYDIALFQFGHTVRCECGHLVDAARPRRTTVAGERAEARARGDIGDLRRRADRITSMILHSDVPSVDIEIARNELREYVRQSFPDRVDLFEMVYEARWRRLAEQHWEHDRPR